MTRIGARRTRSDAHRLSIFLGVSLGWAAIVGAGLHLTRTPLDSIPGLVVVAVLCMPSPLVAAVIAERGFRRERFALPARRRAAVLAFFLAPAAAVVAFVALYAASLLIGGNLLGLPGFGGLATSASEMVAGAVQLLGQEAVDAAGPPPPPIVLLLVSTLGAIIAGWTVNGLVAMGEEYGWRGLMWEQLRHLGVVRSNLIIGTAWGLWHAPLILQGYNYGEPLLGVLAMVLLCIAMSFVLTALREGTASLLPVAAAHGMVNGVVPVVLLLTSGIVPVLTGPLGLLGAAVLLVVAAGAWALVRQRRGSNRCQAPSETTSATPSTTVIAVSSSIA